MRSAKDWKLCGVPKEPISSPLSLTQPPSTFCSKVVFSFLYVYMYTTGTTDRQGVLSPTQEGFNGIFTLDLWNRDYRKACSMKTNTTTASQAILEVATEVLVKTLGCDEEDVSIKSQLMEDLGIGDYDFDYITQKLNRRFGLQLTRQQLFPETHGRVDPKGELTHEVLLNIRREFGFWVDLGHLPTGYRTISDVFTVGLLCEVIAHHLDVQWIEPT